MQKLITEKNIRKERFSSRFIAFLIFLVAVLSISRVVLANRLIESSDSLRDLDQKITQLSSENDILAGELRDKEALSLISSQAAEAGFSQVARLTFVQKSPDVALR